MGSLENHVSSFIQKVSIWVTGVQGQSRPSMHSFNTYCVPDTSGHLITGRDGYEDQLCSCLITHDLVGQGKRNIEITFLLNVLGEALGTA